MMVASTWAVLLIPPIPEVGFPDASGRGAPLPGRRDAQRLRHGEGSASAGDDRQVDELAAEGDRALALALGLLERLDHLASVTHLALVGTEDIVDDIDLAGMDQRFAREAEPASLPRIVTQPFRVADVRPDAIDRADAGASGRDHQRRAAVDQLAR